jgi:hypothetical protein
MSAEILECEDYELFQLSMILTTFHPLHVPISEIDFVTIPAW